MKIRRTGAADYGRWTKALICGPPGSGKTLISSTWPNPFYASAEGGLMSIADRNIPYVDIRSSADLLNIKNSIDQDAEIREKLFGFPIDTIVIDTIDEIQKIVIRERLAETHRDALQLQDWGWLGEQMRAIITGFRNLDMHVVFTCHTKETADEETGRMYFKPNLQGAFASDIPGYVDLALLLKAQPKTITVNDEAQRVIVRSLQTFPDTQHTWIKDRSGKLPQEFNVTFEDDFSRMYETMFGGLDLEEHEEEELGEAQVDDSVLTTDTPSPEKSAPVEADGQQTLAAPLSSEYTCAECGSHDLDENQYDLSKIRFRMVLCKPCFTTAREKVAEKSAKK